MIPHQAFFYAHKFSIFPKDPKFYLHFKHAKMKIFVLRSQIFPQTIYFCKLTIAVKKCLLLTGLV